jgi:hypothetical protein
MSTCVNANVSYYAYTFVIRNLYPSSARLTFRYTIKNVMNPAYQCTTGNFLVQIYNSGMTGVNYSNSITGVSITARNF